MKPFPIDHDLHAHSFLSVCSNDPEETTRKMLERAKAHDYTVQCVTDHYWDALVPDPNGFYSTQDLAHVKQALPLPQDDRVRMVFGCETEFCGGRRLGLHESHYDEFDFIVIPPNHFHMIDFVRPGCYDTEEKVADLLCERLEEIAELDLPWQKVGIAHMNCGLTFREGDVNRVFRLVDEKRYRGAMQKFARHGAGIEINVGCFGAKYEEDKEAHLRLYRMAKEEGCKFYLASDAHKPEGLEIIHDKAPQLVADMGLTEEDLYRIPV